MRWHKLKPSTGRGPSWQARGQDLKYRLKRLRKRKPLAPRTMLGSVPIRTGAEADELLRAVVLQGGPAMVARLGTTEGSVLQHFIKKERNGHATFPTELKKNVLELSGLFPATDETLSRFCRETIDHLQSLDILAVRDRTEEWEFWKLEDFLFKRVTSDIELVSLDNLMPIGSEYSWTASLAGKKVLVVHPFAETIRAQFQRREKIFNNSSFLPSFDLTVVPAVQSIGDNSKTVGFGDWFDALESMKAQIRRADFDIALIGAGAYGLFLAREVKKMDRTSIQIGGALQLLFGIIGKRWSEPHSPDAANVLPHVNEFWVSPQKSETPSGAEKVEGGCYWE